MEILKSKFLVQERILLFSHLMDMLQIFDLQDILPKYRPFLRLSIYFLISTVCHSSPWNIGIVPLAVINFVLCFAVTMYCKPSTSIVKQVPYFVILPDWSHSVPIRNVLCNILVVIICGCPIPLKLSELKWRPHIYGYKHQCTIEISSVDWSGMKWRQTLRLKPLANPAS